MLISPIAGVLLFAGGLDALQTASRGAAVPFTVIMLILIVAIFKMLRREQIPFSRRDIRYFRRISEKLDDNE